MLETTMYSLHPHMLRNMLFACIHCIVHVPDIRYHMCLTYVTICFYTGHIYGIYHCIFVRTIDRIDVAYFCSLAYALTVAVNTFVAY